MASTILTWGTGFFALPLAASSVEEHVRAPTIATIQDGTHVGQVYLMPLPGTDLEAVRKQIKGYPDLHDGHPYGPTFPLDKMFPDGKGGFSIESFSRDYTLTGVPRADLGVLCVARTNFRYGRESLDDACRGLTAVKPAKFTLSARPPAESTEARAMLGGHEVTVRVGPGAKLDDDDFDSVDWGCYQPGAMPGDPKFFADRPGCWVSTYVAVESDDRWPALPERWLYPEETLIEGLIGQDDAYVLSLVGPKSFEIRARVARRTKDGVYVCKAGQRLVPGDDRDKAIARVRGLCSDFAVK
jgi:hypothetical protein